MKHAFVCVAAVLALGGLCFAQPATATTRPATTNASIIPRQHTVDRARERTQLVLQRAKENAGPCDVVFLGDSITERWEQDGAEVWQRYYGQRKALNLGVGGDRTQHTLWRIEQGQLDGLRPKALVFLLGTNNANSCPESEILDADRAVIEQVRRRLPETTILLMGIFPRGETFNPIRGKVTQVNQALAQLDDGKHIFFMDIGNRFVEADGSISREVMKDFVHLAPRGYEIWAEAIEPALRKIIEGQ